MIDIHCHLIYSVDDGAKDRQTALEMLRSASQDGISRIICTPHFSAAAGKADSIREDLGNVAAEYGIALYSGMEYDYNHLKLANEFSGLAGSSFVLLDFCSSTLPSGWETALAQLRVQRKKVIAAHPERLFHKLEAVRALAEAGAFFQLSADSILGYNGRECARFSAKLLGEGLCDYIASDAHGIGRTFHLSECRSWIESRFGGENAARIFESNPVALLEDRKPERMQMEAAEPLWRKIFKKL